MGLAKDTVIKYSCGHSLFVGAPQQEFSLSLFF
jgi:hypothetical protein